MKVLWFSNTPGTGAEFLGSSAIGGGWLSALDKELSTQVELHVAFHYPKYAEDFHYQGVNYYPLCRKNYKWHYVKTKITGHFNDRQELPAYLELVKRIRPDIIHILGSENPYGCIIGEVDVPVVVSMQGNITAIYHKFLSGIERKYLSIVKTRFKRIYDFPFYHSFSKDYKNFERMRAREQRNLRNTRYIIGRTDWDRRITRVLAPQSLYYKGEEMLREPFYHHIWARQDHEKVIIHTTNGNTIYKGFETLCHALSLLNELGYNVEWRVAGINPSDLMVKVAKKYLGKRYPDRGLVLLGAIGEDRLCEKLLEADMYVMPSHIENSPNNLCEAMILGLPCIATYAGGTGSLLKDGLEGILIQDGDPWAMAGAILELHNNREIATSYGKAARERALARHDKQRITEELLKTYETIISRYRGR